MPDIPRFRHPSWWINDPNGTILHDGLWHLFFQANPFGTDWGNMSWGHAVSTDLVSWQHWPVALPCTDTEQAFSGSVVFDARNTSGLGSATHPPLVAVYTAHYLPSSPRHGTQAQCLASSVDGGRTWTRHPGNPVLDRGSHDFRDPKVSADGDGWTMVVAEAPERIILRYRSPDLLDWTLHAWLPVPGEGMAECPDSFVLDLHGEPHEVLLVSVNPVAPGEGSGVRYTIDPQWRPPSEPIVPLDGGLDADVWPRFDEGPDCYAPTTFNDAPDGRRIAIAWMNNWDRAAATPLDGGRGRMTTPRELSLARVGGRIVLRQWPVAEALAVHPGRETADGLVLDDAWGSETFEAGGTVVRTLLHDLRDGQPHCPTP